MEFYALERACIAEGNRSVCGVDEAGRGPLAGPVYAAAVVLPPDAMLPKLNDSKKLSPKIRDALFAQIQEQAVCYGIASASVQEIETLNILQATLLAMNRAIAMLDPAPDFALIDGNICRSIEIPARAIVKGDAECASIAAASILAKVSRDRYMEEIGKIYPQYGFEKHKGYGTKAHYAAIREYGPCPAHRPYFLRKQH